jgi:hypothetical protein
MTHPHGPGRIRGFALGNSISWTAVARDTAGVLHRTVVSSRASNPTDRHFQSRKPVTARNIATARMQTLLACRCSTRGSAGTDGLSRTCVGTARTCRKCAAPLDDRLLNPDAHDPSAVAGPRRQLRLVPEVGRPGWPGRWMLPRGSTGQVLSR